LIWKGTQPPYVFNFLTTSILSFPIFACWSSYNLLGLTWCLEEEWGVDFLPKDKTWIGVGL